MVSPVQCPVRSAGATAVVVFTWQTVVQVTTAGSPALCYVCHVTLPRPAPPRPLRFVTAHSPLISMLMYSTLPSTVSVLALMELPDWRRNRHLHGLLSKCVGGRKVVYGELAIRYGTIEVRRY